MFSLLGLFILSVILGCNDAALSITQGPAQTTQEIGSNFTLKCVVGGIDSTTSDSSILWKLYPQNPPGAAAVPISIGLTSVKERHQVVKAGNAYDLLVKNATYEDDGVFECEAGGSKMSARVYLWDAPDSMALEWEGIRNGPDAVTANQKYQLKCTSKYSHPPASHRYFRAGVPLDLSSIRYTFQNDSSAATGYGDTTSTLEFIPTQTDVDDHSTIKCVADLWDKKEVMAAYMVVNASPVVRSIGVASSMLTLIIALIANY